MYAYGMTMDRTRPRPDRDKEYESTIYVRRFRERAEKRTAAAADKRLEVDWAAYCERERWSEESIPETSSRLILLRGLEDYPTQKATAEGLHMTQRQITYHVNAWGLGRKNRKRRLPKLVGFAVLLLLFAGMARAAVNPWGNYVCWEDSPGAAGYMLLSAAAGDPWQLRADSVDRGQPFPTCIDYWDMHCCLLPADPIAPGELQFIVVTAYNSWGESPTEHGSYPGDLP